MSPRYARRRANRHVQVASLGYHEVTDAPSDTGFQRPGAFPYKHATADFREHLDRIAAAPVAPRLVSETDLTTGRHLFLTFDDGGSSALETAEMLGERGWKGHFFVVTALIGRPGFLKAEDIRYLRSQGHLIGSHSHTHPDIFRDLEPAGMAEEWRTSREILREVLGETCVTASVPGGDISPAVLRSARLAGFRHLFTSEPRLAPLDLGGCWILGRLVVKNSMTARRLQRRVRFEGWARDQMLRQMKEAGRRALPALYRWYVQWSTIPPPGHVGGLTESEVERS